MGKSQNSIIQHHYKFLILYSPTEKFFMFLALFSCYSETLPVLKFLVHHFIIDRHIFILKNTCSPSIIYSIFYCRHNILLATRTFMTINSTGELVAQQLGLKNACCSLRGHKFSPQYPVQVADDCL